MGRTSFFVTLHVSCQVEYKNTYILHDTRFAKWQTKNVPFIWDEKSVPFIRDCLYIRKLENHFINNTGIWLCEIIERHILLTHGNKVNRWENVRKLQKKTHKLRVFAKTKKICTFGTKTFPLTTLQSMFLWVKKTDYFQILKTVLRKY